jgi:hypothetical protein
MNARLWIVSHECARMAAQPQSVSHMVSTS